MKDNMIIYYYPTCSTVKKAMKYLDENEIKYERKHIVEETMTAEELSLIIRLSGLELKRFFNTSGKAYRELNFKEKKNEMSEGEIVDFLVANPMLLKRPIIKADDFALVGFKVDEYDKVFKS